MALFGGKNVAIVPLGAMRSVGKATFYVCVHVCVGVVGCAFA